MTYMRDEATDSPGAVSRCLAQSGQFEALGVRLRALDPSVVVVSARGSSGQAGTYLRYLLARDLGVVAAAAMPSIASVYGREQRLRGCLFVAVSQSGRSPDLLAQARAAAAAGAMTLAIVNDPGSPLAAICEAVIDIAAGPERSVAATKTVIASMAAGLALAAAWTGDPAMARAAAALPGRLAQAACLDWSALTALLARVDRMFAIGRGPGFAVAGEAALKLAEVGGLAGLAYSAAEFAHGPQTLAGPACPVMAFVQDDATRAGTISVLQGLAERGVPVLAAGHGLPALPDAHPDADLLGQLLCFYLALEQASVASGRDPDHPPGLRKITETV